MMRILKDPATVGSRIFVGHLQTDDTTKTELEEYFGKYGNIVGSAINRGFAFIQFDSDQAAQSAIKGENGTSFKGRRIDVKPAKKDANAPAVPPHATGQGQGMGNMNNSFGMNQCGGGGGGGGGGGSGGPIMNKMNMNNENQQFGNNEQFNNSDGMNKGGNNVVGGGNQNQQFANKSQAGGGGQPARTRGNRGGKKKRLQQQQMQENQNFRDRSPVTRQNDMSNFRDGQGNFRNNFNESGNRFDTSGSMIRDSFGTSSGPSMDFSMSEKNDCEIIVVSKLLTEYAEMIELRLKKMGLTVDLLFPNEEVPLSRVLGNIASRGCLYAVVITPTNQEHRSLTLNVLHGLPQEHRNMPVDDAIALMSRDFGNYKAGGRSVPLNAPMDKDRHPDAVQVLLNMLADNHQLTVLQYDRVIKYLEVKREDQVQIELGDVKELATSMVNDPKQAELQSRILNILNSSNKPSTGGACAASQPATTANWSAAAVAAPAGSSVSSVPTSVTTSSTAAATAVTPSPLLNDPTVQKALDSLLQGNLLKSIGDAPTSATAAAASAAQPTAAPLFAAFSNASRF